MKKSNRGITLIALVITIIVLLILAGITINLTIGDQGIITRAQQASKNYKDAEQKEKEELAKLDNYNWGEDDGGLEQIPGSKEQPGKRVEETEKDNFTDRDNKTATVPKGFTVSGIEEEQHIDNGLVIYDIPEGETVENWNEDSDNNGIRDVQEKYNQFVWVPETSYDTREESGYESTYEGEGTEESGSIKEYGGYYIGRYETGKEGSKAVVKRNKEAYTEVEIAEAVTKSKEFYIDEAHGVGTNLVKGKQWNSTMEFVGDEVNTNEDSSLWGNYANYEYKKNGEKLDDEFDGNWNNPSFPKKEGKVLFNGVETGTVTTTINKTSVNSVDKLHLNIKFKNDYKENRYACFTIYGRAQNDQENKIDGLTVEFDTSDLDTSLFRIDAENTTSERLILYTNNSVESGSEIEINDIGLKILGNLEDVNNANLSIEVVGDFVDEHQAGDAAFVPQENSIKVVKLDMRDDYIVDNLLENKNYQIKKTASYPYSDTKQEIPMIVNTPKVTGYSEDWKAKNIYDLAGNIEEWTMEKETETSNYLARGGKCYNFGDTNCANSRNITNEKSDTLGYRVAMYIK